MRTIGLDVHRSFAQVAILEHGKIRDAGRIDLERCLLLESASKLRPDDEIVIEATEPPRVYRRAKLSENCPLWNMHKRRRPRGRI